MRFLNRLADEYYEGVSEGWPLILSGLKSLIERGTALAYFGSCAPTRVEDRQIYANGSVFYRWR